MVQLPRWLTDSMEPSMTATGSISCRLFADDGCERSPSPSRKLQLAAFPRNRWTLGGAVIRRRSWVSVGLVCTEPEGEFHSSHDSIVALGDDGSSRRRSSRGMHDSALKRINPILISLLLSPMRRWSEWMVQNAC